MRRPSLLLPLLSVLACAHTVGRPPQQTLAPTSARDAADDLIVSCADAVLASSPLVERVVRSGRADSPRTRGVRLRNPPGQCPTGLLFSIVPSRGPARELVFEYVSPSGGSPGGMKPPTDPKTREVEGEMLADISVRLLLDVRGECAPNAPGQPMCSRVAQDRGGRCVLGT
jgi:hypothetical protein